MEYSTAVRQRFERPEAVGTGGDHAVSAEAQDQSLNVWVRITVQTRGGLLDVTYNAFGCPHMIAACEQVARWLTGRNVADLRRVDLDAVVRELDFPREKFGKLLRVEDALLACADHLERLDTARGSE